MSVTKQAFCWWAAAGLVLSLGACTLKTEGLSTEQDATAPDDASLTESGPPEASTLDSSPDGSLAPDSPLDTGPEAAPPDAPPIDSPEDAPDADPVDAPWEADLDAPSECAPDAPLEASDDAPSAVCGNGVPESPEECDDGNLTNGDGCSFDCHKECTGSGTVFDPASHHCYWLDTDEGNWGDGAGRCQGRGGHMVTFSSQAEIDLVLTLGADEPWIGATDNKDIHDRGAGTYSWVTGETWFEHWASGEPNANGSTCGVVDWRTCYEHCAILLSDGHYNDHRCDRDHPFLCEREPSTAPPTP